MLRKELEDNATPDINFHAKLTQQFGITSQYVSYQTVVLNNGSGLDGETGIFTAPKAGTYLFTFHAQMDNPYTQRLHITLNGEYQTGIVNDNGLNSYHQTSTMSITIILSLEVNDTVGIYLVDGGLKEDSYFSGILVR